MARSANRSVVGESACASCGDRAGALDPPRQDAWPLSGSVDIDVGAAELWRVAALASLLDRGLDRSTAPVVYPTRTPPEGFCGGAAASAAAAATTTIFRPVTHLPLPPRNQHKRHRRARIDERLSERARERWRGHSGEVWCRRLPGSGGRTGRGGRESAGRDEQERRGEEGEEDGAELEDAVVELEASGVRAVVS